MKLRTLTEAAEILGVSRRQLRDGVMAGRYPSITWGNRLLVDLDVLAGILEDERQRRERHDGLIGLRECAEAIGLTPDQLRRMALRGMVPYTKRGRYYCFILADVEMAIRTHMK